MSEGLLVCIVDDNRSYAECLRHFLSRRGHRVVAARSVSTAKSLLAQVVPDVVLCDVRLPDGSGIDLVRWIRLQPALANARVLVITGAVPEEAARLENQLIVDKSISMHRIVRIVEDDEGAALPLSGRRRITPHVPCRPQMCSPASIPTGNETYGYGARLAERVESAAAPGLAGGAG
jgi:CheY-like chemotaxis protein